MYIHTLLYTQTTGHYRKYIGNLDTWYTDRDNTRKVTMRQCAHLAD